MKNFYYAAIAAIVLPMLILFILCFYSTCPYFLWTAVIMALIIVLFVLYAGILILKYVLKQKQQKQEFAERKDWEEFRSRQYSEQEKKENKNQ